MKFNIKKVLFLGIIVAIAGVSCKKKNISLENNLPDIPVTVVNPSGNFGGSTVNTSLTLGTIKIVLSIPKSSGRIIKEITRVGAGNIPGVVQTTKGLYSTAPIPGNGTIATFETNLNEYQVRADVAKLPDPGLATSFLPKNFYFMITLDNGQVIISTPVRVYLEK